MSLLDSVPLENHNSHFLVPDHDDDHDDDRENDNDDADTASQLSISLSSPAGSPRSAVINLSPLRAHEALSNSREDSIEIDFNSETDDVSEYTSEMASELDARRESSITSAAPSVLEEPKTTTLPTYPPRLSSNSNDAGSFSSAASSYSKKARPESMLLQPPDGPLVLGVALIDFNHLVGPKIEFYKGDIFEDEEVSKILPFLALPDGAHMSLEDYSYFHLVPSSPNPSTIFGISCNRQIPASTLLVKDADVTRSIVQKAVVVLVSRPVFGPIRDKLGVVTRALFNQRDFRETNILVDFISSLETSLRTQLTESGLYMGTSLRDFVHTFRHRTLVLVKALILQKKIIFFGHPVERLCNYQYSLISLIPGLLQTLDDCGSPPLASRAPTLSRPSSLRTSDRKSMMAYMGLPLDVFGKDAFFQPYLPLQQIDLLKDSQSWLCGSTNSIVTQQKEIELLINTENATLEFRDPRLERVAGLTAADRKWMDEIVRDVNEGWSESEATSPTGIHFKGSDDYLRAKFEEYIFAALASVRYREFLIKGKGGGVIIAGGPDVNSIEDFNPLWITEFMKTNAYQVWDRTTDPMLFDIVEPRHPCNEKPSVVADIGLRLSEGIQELKLDQQLAPTREAISRTLTAGSTNFFKAVEGVKGRWGQRTPSSVSTSDISSVPSTPVTPVVISKSDADFPTQETVVDMKRQTSRESSGSGGGTRPVSVTQAASETKAALGAWGAGIQSFWSTRAARFSQRGSVTSFASTTPIATPVQSPVSETSFSHSQSFTAVTTVTELPEHDEEGAHVHVDLEEVHTKDHMPAEEPTGMAL